MSTYWLLERVGLPYPLAIVGGMLITALAGWILWIFIVLPLWRRQAAAFVVILATLVFQALMQETVLHTLGTDPRTLPVWTTGLDLKIGGGTISGQYVLVLVATLLILAALGLFLRYTALGRSMRAVASGRETAELLGISPERIGALTIVVAAGLGGLGGLLIAPAQLTAFDAGLTYGVYGFVAAIAGGFGSLPGALVGGLLVGLLQALTARYVSTTFEAPIAFGVLLVLLVVRPQGLWGKRWEQAVA
jgi:branched-chain amino acid transport system permease protein